MTATFHGLIVNVCAYYCRSSWAARLDNNARLRDASQASIVWVTESNGYTQGKQLSNAYGWGGVMYNPADKGTWNEAAYILHGGSAGITTSIHWDPDKWRLHEDIGNTSRWPFITEPGTTHRWATAGLLERRSTSQFILNGVTHTQYKPIGKNTIPAYDRERYRQMSGFLTKLDQFAARFENEYDTTIARLGTGDFNSRYGTDPYCRTIGVTKAMTDRGYKDFRVAAEIKAGSPANIIDRGCFKGKVRVREHKVLPDNGATDHDTAAAVLLAVG